MTLVFESVVDFMPRIDKMTPQRLDSALFGMGCSFESEPRFGIAKGVWRTTLGYSGGRYESPSYENLGDHAEVIMVEYDPLALSYGQLLDIFFNRCDCRGNSPPHCISHVFVKNEFEKRLAQAAVARYKLRFSKSGYVKIAMHKTFYKAEQWRQKRFLRMIPPLMDELRRMYPDEDRLIQSTLATRLNGILGQRSSQGLSFPFLPEDVTLYDLSDSAAGILKNAMGLPVKKVTRTKRIEITFAPRKVEL